MGKQRVLVTGGSGFVGTNLVARFIERGWAVLNLDIAKPRNEEHLGLWKQVDVLDRDELTAATQAFEPSVFLHFAARTDLDEEADLAGYAANTQGVCNVVDAIRSTPSVGRVIFASSQLVCELGYKPRDERDYRPTTTYGHSKAVSEMIVRAAGHMASTWIIVRPTSLWGPWFRTPYREFFAAIGRGAYVPPRGMSTLKQWGYVGNSVHQVHGLVEARAESVHGRTLYLADYEPVQLRDFVNRVQRSLGASPIRSVPPKLLRAVALGGDALEKLGWGSPPLTTFRYGNIVTDELQDLEPLREIVGSLPFTVQDGIDATVNWLEEHEALAAARHRDPGLLKQERRARPA